MKKFAKSILMLSMAMVMLTPSTLVAESTIKSENITSSSNAIELENKNFTLQINPNYKDAKITSQLIKEGNMVNTARLSVNDRYGFDKKGFFYDKACTKPVNTEFKATGDITLYAGWEVWTNEKKNLMDYYLSERDSYEYIISYPLAFEKESFTAYFKYAKQFFGTRFNGFTKEQLPALNQLKSLRESLIELTSDYDSTVLYIWGDDMPEAEDVSDYDYYLALDYPEFKPFLVPYLVEDQSKAKGNIIVIAGGGFYNRSNLYEGYATAEYYQSQNYNAYVLQRRVAPSEEVDSSLDLQRAMRYIQYNAKSLGINKVENISAIGYSGGGMTITNMVQKFKADSLPTEVYKDYQVDEIDKISTELDAMLIIYGAVAGGFTDIESLKLPQTFIACGEEDIARQNCIDMYTQIVDRTRTELYLYADAPHGVALGETTYGTATAASQWPQLSITFLDITYGYQPSGF